MSNRKTVKLRHTDILLILSLLKTRGADDAKAKRIRAELTRVANTKLDK